MSHIFISYSRKDQEIAKRIAAELRKANHEAFLDVTSIALGSSWGEGIDNALRNADAVIVVLSPESAKSSYVTYEWAFALGAMVRILPIVVKQAKLHPRLATLQYLDFSGPVKEWARLIKEISALKPKQGTDASGHGLAKSNTEPVISGTFELNKGRPVREKNWYKIWIETRRAPEGTDRVTYEIHDPDDTFDKKKFTIRRSHGENFSSWITSDGDLFLTAKGKGRDGKLWQTQTSLSDSLRRGMGRNLTPAVKRALTEIERN